MDRELRVNEDRMKGEPYWIRLKPRILSAQWSNRYKKGLSARSLSLSVACSNWYLKALPPPTVAKCPCMLAHKNSLLNQSNDPCSC